MSSLAGTTPKTHKALMLEEIGKPLIIKHIPVPPLTPGSAILRILSASVLSYQWDLYNGTRNYGLEVPMVPGFAAVGRIVSVGPDSSTLNPGQLVFFDPFVRARDNPSVAMISGLIHGIEPAARRLTASEWRDSTFAEYARVPLENCYALNEAMLCESGGMAYSFDQLVWLSMPAVGYGGLRTIGLQAGETVIVAPATGGFGGAAALVAAAMGARVLAMGRNTDKLGKLSKMSSRIHTVRITGDVEKDTQELLEFGAADAFLDLSPPGIGELFHFKSAIGSLRKGGRVSVMGGMGCDMQLPFGDMVFRDLEFKGKWMYDPVHVRDLIKLVETGALGLEQMKVTARFKLEDWQRAFETAAKMSFDEVTVLYE